MVFLFFFENLNKIVHAEDASFLPTTRIQEHGNHMTLMDPSSLVQVALRWIYEQGLTPIVKSFSKERLMQNLEIFDWDLTEDDLIKIGQIPQKKIATATSILFSPEGDFTSVNLSDIDIVEE
jgi:hypothetical protein